MATQLSRLFLAAAVALLLPPAAHAWSRAGHMVTAAIAWDDLAARDHAVLDKIGVVLAAHPDRGAFDVAVGDALGEERARLLLLECARWPDDARGTIYDHPTWHYAFAPVVREGDAPRTAPPESLDGDALEAFALNARVMGNPKASDAERAIALCWVMHVGGDIHQPLHAAQLFSVEQPSGDQGGGHQFVRAPPTNELVTLHWFWDDAVQHVGEPDAVEARARELVARLPRARLGELAEPARARDFPRWARDESYPLAVSLAYRSDAKLGSSAETAVALTADYVAAAAQAAERRVVIAGYRLADVLREAFAQRK